eukprot:scaffold136871_cov63-Phaeocystis_antarctica.AAC.6
MRCGLAPIATSHYDETETLRSFQLACYFLIRCGCWWRRTCLAASGPRCYTTLTRFASASASRRRWTR